MACPCCNEGKIKEINRFSYITFANIYYKCEECRHEYTVFYPRESMKRINGKMYMQCWSK